MASMIKPRMLFTCRWPLGPTTNTATRIMPNFFASCQNKSLKWWKIFQPPTRQAAANLRRQHWRRVTVTTPQDTWTRARGYRVSDPEWDQSKGATAFSCISWARNSMANKLSHWFVDRTPVALTEHLTRVSIVVSATMLWLLIYNSVLSIIAHPIQHQLFYEASPSEHLSLTAFHINP